MRIIAGLGNPGPEYALTRHNVGWNVIDRLVDKLNAGKPQEKFGGAFWGPLLWNGERVGLLKPYTYMNDSGVAVGEVARFYRVEPSKILVVVDDINLPLGKMRLRVKGSAGGHNGLKSIIAHLSSQEFCRLRIGVGACPADRGLAAWVLGGFSKEQRLIIDASIDSASEFCLRWCSTAAERLMNSVNSYDGRPRNESNDRPNESDLRG
ncbi:MAG: aminoacyl-tRNA hydrolase [Pyramidobacter sp.]